jgi:hypothetical protein
MRSHPTRFEYLKEAIKHPPADGAKCMEWPYAADVLGYGYLSSSYGEKRVHRLAYILHYGPMLPGPWCICHKCDNPRCFRPSHLFLGTKNDNTQDCIRKGRRIYPDHHGEAHSQSRLTEAQIREINTLYLSGKDKADIARQFGISRSHLKNISNRHRWAHLTDLSWNR